MEIIILTAVIIYLGILAICWTIFSGNSLCLNKIQLYEVKKPNEFPTYRCPECGYNLLPLPPNPKGEFQCLHCQTYYNLKLGGKICNHSDTKNGYQPKPIVSGIKINPPAKGTNGGTRY